MARADSGVDELHVLWISEGMSCDGDTVSITDRHPREGAWADRPAHARPLAGLSDDHRFLLKFP